MFKDLSIGTRMLIGFAVPVFIFSCIVLIGINRMNFLSEITSRMYKHPLTVSNAALKINTNIIKIHRTMKDVVLVLDVDEIKQVAKTVDVLETEVYRDFKIIEERFLGKEMMYKETLRLFNEWKPIRDEVIALMYEAKQHEAAEITKGKGARHVEKLEASIGLLSNFAELKALEFYNRTQKTRDRAIRIMLILFAAAFALSFIFMLMLVRSIMKPLTILKNNIDIIRRGDLDTAITIKSGGEIAELGRDFNDMRLKLRKSHSHLEQKIAEKTNDLALTLEEIQEHNLQLTSTQNAMLNLVKDMEESQEHLRNEVENRRRVEYALQKAHDTLELRICERTKELRKTHEQLLHVEKLSAIGGLSASIAHEFNNPLQGVMTVIKGVRKRAPLEKEDAKLLDMAILECDRMKDLIKSLQDFNRPTSGRVAPMDIHAAIRSLLLLSRNEFDKKKITVETSLGEKIPEIQAVSDQIKQVLLNLIKNAIYACEDGETITIQTVAKNKNIIIRIIDTGTGIAPEFIGHIFEPFYTTKPDIKGTGLGLSVSYGIVKEHGGTIEVESEIGKGTTFTVILPIDLQPTTGAQRPNDQ